MSERQPNSRSISFRIDPILLKDLEQEAFRNDVSLNFLVNQIVKNHLEWNRFEDSAGMMPFPKRMFLYMIEMVTRLQSDEENARHPDMDRIAHKAAGMVSETLKELVAFMGKEYNFHTALSSLREYMKACGIDTQHRVDGTTHIVIVYHNLGKNWSLFAKELSKLILEDAAKARVETYATSDVAVAEVRL